jgi:two-component system response regulator YesN
MIRVLVVEDEIVAAQHIVKCIERASSMYSVLGICRNRAETLEMYERALPDIIFSDIRLGKDNGISIMEELRKKGWTGQLVIMSVYGNFAFAKRAIQIDVEDYLLKPIFEEDIKNVLNKLYIKRNGTLEDRIVNEILSVDINNLSKHIRKAIEYIAIHYRKQIPLTEIANYACVSETYLSSDFSKQTGYTLISFLNLLRLSVSKELLRTTEDSLETIALSIGFTDVVYYSRLYKRFFGESPGQYRKHENQLILD